MTAIGSHQSSRARTTNWITPPHIIEALGPFDLDPCACETQPWPCAARSYTVADDGLNQPWHGRVWLNPPYGRETAAWLRKMARHNRGTALVFARTETAMFFESVWPRAWAVNFLEGRLAFYRPDGTHPNDDSGGPSVLIAYGREDAERLRRVRGRVVML